MSFLEVLRQRLSNGTLRKDENQWKAAKRLSRLQTAMENYSNESLVEQYFSERDNTTSLHLESKAERETKNNGNYFGESNRQSGIRPIEQPSVRIPRGLYLYGSVGSGKSMLMDTFFDTISIPRSKRWHFHAFLSMVHQRVHALKGKPKHHSENPIQRVGVDLAEEYCIICLDEFQVTDIADATILSQLFSALWRLGTVVVTTSNRPPSDLYLGGLHRSYVMPPFIDMLHRHCIVHELDGTVDYRVELSKNCYTYFASSKNGMIEKVAAHLRQGRPEESVQLKTGYGRTWTVNGDADGRVARLSFDEICGGSRCRSASDFRALTGFQVIAVEQMEVLVSSDKARRFITFIDELYEGKTALMIETNGAKDPEELFLSTHDQSRDLQRNEMGVDHATIVTHGEGALASVQELSFAFQRAESRIREMTTQRWWDITVQGLADGKNKRDGNSQQSFS